MGRKNVKNMQKANKICYYFGGESKGPEKKTKNTVCIIVLPIIPHWEL